MADWHDLCTVVSTYIAYRVTAYEYLLFYSVLDTPLYMNTEGTGYSLYRYKYKYKKHGSPPQELLE